MKYKYTLLFCVYNNTETLKELYNRTVKVLKDIDYKLLFINDGSLDNSKEIIEEICLRDKNVELINLNKNKGQINGILTGMRNIETDFLISLDADLQDPPEIISNLIELSKNQDIDLVIAARKSTEENFIKKITSSIHHRLINFSNKLYPRNGFNVFCVKKNLYKKISLIPESMLCLQIDLLEYSSKINTFYYDRKKSKNNISKSSFFWRLDYSLKMITHGSLQPLRFCLIFGFIVTIMSFLYILYILFHYFFLGDFPYKGWPPIIILSLFFGSLSLFFTGILGEYLSELLKILKTNKKNQINNFKNLD